MRINYWGRLTGVRDNHTAPGFTGIAGLSELFCSGAAAKGIALINHVSEYPVKRHKRYEPRWKRLERVGRCRACGAESHPNIFPCPVVTADEEHDTLG